MEIKGFRETEVILRGEEYVMCDSKKRETRCLILPSRGAAIGEPKQAPH
jgi:hypothetical protein